MKIHVATGRGIGPTALSAFDAALIDAGVANFNLLRLSSVIPPRSTLVRHHGVIPPEVMSGGWGDRLYVVIAEQRATTPNTEAWAGIGWVQDHESGKGLFVEHEGASERTVRRDIEQSLQALMKNRHLDFGEIHMVVTGKTCVDHPVCSLAVAVFQASDWMNTAYPM